MNIILNGIKIFAYHGVDPQENKVGSYFYVDLVIATDFSRAAQTDELEGTISYADVFERVKQEMSIPSKLLEHVCQRMAQRLFNDFDGITSLDIQLSKENPPMGSESQQVGVSVHYDR